jgi:hypothetical protein
MNITLDVQGQIFKTKYENILKIPYFKDMFETCGQPSETIFVDRPAHIFKHIIGLITDPLYPYPEKYKFELDFFGIDCENLYDVNDKQTKKLINVINTSSYIKCDMDECYTSVEIYKDCKLTFCAQHVSSSCCNIADCDYYGELNGKICNSCKIKYG